MALSAPLISTGCGPGKSAPSPDSFDSARARFHNALDAFESHLWDPDGTERRKALAALDAAGEALKQAPGRPADLPHDRLSVALGKLTAEAHAFSTMIGRQESTGKAPASGFPWPYEYRDSAAQIRSLLGIAPAGH